MRFKLVEGGLHHENGKYYKKGDIIETSRPLDKMFGKLGPKKFQRITASHSPEDAKTQAESPGTSSQLSVDVTDASDKELLELNLRVVKKGSWYDVVDAITGKKLNEKSLRKEQIPDFVKQYKAA